MYDYSQGIFIYLQYSVKILLILHTEIIANVTWYTCMYLENYIIRTF